MAVLFPEVPKPEALTEEYVDYFFDYLIACLNRRRLELLAIVRDTRLEMAARPAAQAREERELIGLRAETERRLEMNPLHTTQDRILAEIDERLAEIRAPQPETRVIFRGDARDLDQLIRGVGEVVEEGTSNIPRYLRMCPILAVGKQGKAPGELWIPHGMAIDSNNQIYIVEGDATFARVSICSEMGEFIDTFTHEHMKYPWDIAIHNDNVYVTDIREHSVFQFKRETDIRLVARLGGKGSGTGQFDVPRQLAVSNQGEIFVIDCGNDRIKILDSSLHYQRHISHESMTCPWDVKLTPDEVYILTPTDSPCVHVFSHAGDKIRSLITRGPDPDMQIFAAFFFCLDTEGNLVISDWWRSRIRIFSKEGILLRTLGEEGHEVGMFVRPSGIAITNSLKLVIVSENNNCRLQIFY